MGNGSQKALGGAIVTLLSTFVLQIINNQPIDVSTQSVEVSTLVGQLVASLVASGIAYAVVWAKANILRLSDGVVAKMQFVKKDIATGTGTVVNEAGIPTGVKVRSHWLVGLGAIAITALAACATKPDGTWVIHVPGGVDIDQGTVNCGLANLADADNHTGVQRTYLDKVISAGLQCILYPELGKIVAIPADEPVPEDAESLMPGD